MWHRCSPYCFPVQSWRDWRAESLPVRAVKSLSILSQKLDSSQGRGLKVTSLFSWRRTSYRQRSLWRTKSILLSIKRRCREVFREWKQLMLNVTYLSLRSRCVRRIRSTRSLYLGLNTFPVENLRDTFFTDWTSLLKWANSSVSVYLWNFAALLM